MKDSGFVTLYKYLDAQGGLKMLQNSNLQFTNATKFNDPFDCHPALFDYSNAPITKQNPYFADFMKKKGKNDMRNLRNSSWMCCLSKVYDSLLMWAYYNSHKDLLTTKAKAWEHEQEVRLITKNPFWIHAGKSISQEFHDEELVDGKEIRHYPPISGDCFESVYLGVNIFHRDRDEIIKAAKERNPEIKIYQMTIDPEAFRLKAEIIES